MPSTAVGSAVIGGGVTSNIVDNKFLSSVWSLKDQNKKISKGEWIRNDAADTGVDGKGKRIDIEFSNQYFDFKLNIRNKQGGIYPSHMMLDYKTKNIPGKVTL